MQRFGMNTYLYAPKDDYKHRLDWRELYTEEQAGMLNQLLFRKFITWKICQRFCWVLKVENGRLLDRYRIGTDTGCIVSNRIGYCCIGRYYVHHCRFINCWWIALHTMIKGHSNDPSPARRARTHACRFMVHDTGEGWRGGRRKETVTWYQPPHDAKTTQYWSWPPSHRTPSTSRKW